MSKFFVDENEEDEVPVREIKKHNRNEISPEYIPIKLSSVGKLSAPPILHVKDYTMEDALELSLASEDDILGVMVKVLNNMTHENFDCAYLHTSELAEIMLTVYGSFWSSTIQQYKYPWKEEELSSLDEVKANDIRSGKKPVFCDIPISQIKTDTIPSDFKEPVVLTYNDRDLRIEFILPRVIHILNAREYIENKFQHEEKQFSDLKADLKYNEDVKNNPHIPRKKINPILYTEYEDYMKKRSREYIIATQAQLIYKINNHKLGSMKEQIKSFPQVSFSCWRDYNNTVKKRASFGINNSVEIISPITKHPVARRFLFQLMDLLPTVDLENDSGYSVSFGN